jgi:hypothetical protein
MPKQKAKNKAFKINELKPPAAVGNVAEINFNAALHKSRICE